MIPATEGVVRLQMKSKSSMPWTARGCRPLEASVSISRRCTGAAWLAGWALLDEASCLGVEEGVGSRRAQWPAGSYETTNVIIGSEAFLSRGVGWRRGGPVDRHSGGHCGRLLWRAKVSKEESSACASGRQYMQTAGVSWNAAGVVRGCSG
jgi:hypothetical protein